MNSAHIQFSDNIKRARDLGNLFNALSTSTKGALDLSDLLRSEIVFAVSAFDYLIHELCRIGMIQSAKGLRAKTEAFKRYQISLASVEQLTFGVSEEVWLGSAIREKHSWLSFQDPEKVADAIRLTSALELWKEVGKDLGIPPEDLKRTLKLIVDRRNKIAHESDIDPTLAGAKWPITDLQAIEVVNVIEKIGNSIFKLVK